MEAILKLRKVLKLLKWESDIYLPVFNKCLTKKRLYSDEYKQAKDLEAIGFMKVFYKPTFRGKKFHGNIVAFKSIANP